MKNVMTDALRDVEQGMDTFSNVLGKLEARLNERCDQCRAEQRKREDARVREAFRAALEDRRSHA